MPAWRVHMLHNRGYVGKNLGMLPVVFCAALCVVCVRTREPLDVLIPQKIICT